MIGSIILVLQLVEHDPEKACPALDAGWIPVFGKDHAPTLGFSADAARNRDPAASGLRVRHG
jgi:hypothetical protein